MNHAVNTNSMLGSIYYGTNTSTSGMLGFNTSTTTTMATIGKQQRSKQPFVDDGGLVGNMNIAKITNENSLTEV